MTLSVVVPARNEEAHLPRCLEALAIQSGAVDFEVVVVDNGSTDRTSQIVESFSTRLPLRLLSLPRCSIAAVRNFGANAAHGRLLAFLDADCAPRPGWLEAVLRHGAGAGIISGSAYLPPPNANWLARAWAGHEQRFSCGVVSYVPGGTMILQRQDFFQWNGFDEALRTNEDVEFCARARFMGARIEAWPDLAVVHWGTPSRLWQFFRKQHWHGADVGQVFFASLPSLVNVKAVGFALSSVVFAAGVAAGAIWWIAGKGPSLLAASAVGLAFPPLLLATASVRRRAAWHDAPALTLLFLLYGLARAAALFSAAERPPTATGIKSADVPSPRR